MAGTNIVSATLQPAHNHWSSQGQDGVRSGSATCYICTAVMACVPASGWPVLLHSYDWSCLVLPAAALHGPYVTCGVWLTVLQVKLLDSVGFDYTFNYKTHSKLEALDEAAPDGIDIYW